MSNYFNKEDIKKIQVLNDHLGMKHRTKPFDMANIDDLREAFKLLVCELLDYHEYDKILYDLVEKFDESVEHFDPATWINMTLDSSKCDKLVTKAIDSLNKAETAFSRLTKRAEDKCKEMLHILLDMDESIQMEILGSYYQPRDGAIDGLFETIFELEYKYNMEDGFESFLGYIQEKLSLIE